MDVKITPDLIVQCSIKRPGLNFSQKVSIKRPGLSHILRAPINEVFIKRPELSQFQILEAIDEQVR